MVNFEQLDKKANPWSVVIISESSRRAQPLDNQEGDHGPMAASAQQRGQTVSYRQQRGEKLRLISTIFFF